MEYNKACQKCGGVNPENADRCLNCGGEIKKLPPEELALFLAQKRAAAEQAEQQLKANEETRTISPKERNKKVIDFQILNFHKGTRWLQIYVFALLPIRIGFGVLSILSIISVLASQSASKYAGLSLFLSLLDLGLAIAAYIHMKKLKKDGYLYNNLWLVSGLFTTALPNAIVNTMYGTGTFMDIMLIQSIAYALAILLPNCVYFAKRKELFDNPLEKSDEEIFGSQTQQTSNDFSNAPAGYHLDGTFAETLKEHPVVAPLLDEPPAQEAEPIAAIPQMKENASEAAAVTPELPQIKVKKPKQKKNRFCKLCGSLIEPQSKCCTGCGKKYFKIRIPKKYIYPAVSILIIIGLSVGFIYQTYQKNQILEQKNSALEYKQSTIDSLRGEIDRLESEQESAVKILKLSIEKAAFLDKYIAIIETGTGNVYHKHGCEELEENSSFIAYNIKIAEAKGYKPCTKCCPGE